MGYDINAGKQKARIGYCGYLILMQKAAAKANPESESLFDSLLRGALAGQDDKWDKLFDMLPAEIVRFICIDEVDTIPHEIARKFADILDLLDNLSDREITVRDVFRYARRYRANIHIC